MEPLEELEDNLVADASDIESDSKSDPTEGNPAAEGAITDGESGAATEGVPGASVDTSDSVALEEEEEEDDDILLMQAGKILVDTLEVKSEAVASNR